MEINNALNLNKTQVEFINDIDPVIVEKSGHKLLDLYNFEIHIETRILILNELYEEIKDSIFEIIKKFIGIYQFSGVNSMFVFISKICTDSTLDVFLKFECIKTLLHTQKPLSLDFNPFEDDDDDDKNISTLSGPASSKSTDADPDEMSALNIWETKIRDSFVILSDFDISDLPTLCKLEAIYYLMESEDHLEKALSLFTAVLLDNKLPVEYRYKILHTLETKEGIIFNNKYPDYIIKNSFLKYVSSANEPSYYRCLGIQYLFKNKDLFELEVEQCEVLENILLDFAEDTTLDYNRRADAADTLACIGSPDNKKKAKQILASLGNINGIAKTVFENSQNVHSASIEKSVMKSIKNIMVIHIEKTYLFSDIKRLVKKIYKEKNSYISDKLCGWCTVENCTRVCLPSAMYKNIKMALNRIYLDSIIYTKLYITLVKLFEKVFSIIMEHEHRDELLVRMLQELDDMHDTCSSGYISRIVNILSGYSETIKISWEEQISANFTGRLNCFMKNIHTFYKNSFHKIFSYYIDKKKYIYWTIEELQSIKLKNDASLYQKVSDIISELYINDKITIPTITLSKDIFFEKCLASFSKNVINEISLSSDDPLSRKGFLMFFNDTMPLVRSEMKSEFLPYITDSDFDTYFKNAICLYFR